MNFVRPLKHREVFWQQVNNRMNNNVLYVSVLYEMGWACGTYGWGEGGVQGLGGETGGKETTGET